MKIAFKKNPKTIVAKSICWWTDKPHFHCDILFSFGISFSAFAELNKTTFKTVYYNESDWDFIDIPITFDEENLIFEWCKTELNCGYDFSGIILTQILPLSFQSRTRWFCSELCLAALQHIGWFSELKAYQYDPGELYTLIMNFLNERKNNEEKI